MSTPSQGFPLPLGLQLSGFHGDVSMGSPNGTQSSDDSEILYPTNWPLAEEFYDFEPHESDPPLGTSTESSPVGPSTPAPRHTSSAIPQSRTPLNDLEAQILGIVPPSTGRSQPSRANPDPRTRELRTFYDISLLTERPDRYPEQVHIAMLRRKWKQKFLESSVGKWDYVEYVPPWTDPDVRILISWTSNRTLLCPFPGPRQVPGDTSRGAFGNFLETFFKVLQKSHDARIKT